jgi:hypothetical protein
MDDDAAWNKPAAGTLTLDMIRQSLDALWNGDRENPIDDRFTGLLNILKGEDAPRPCCKATLFEPEVPLMRLIAMEGIPLHPCDVVYCGPIQGPTPLACAREPHPGSPWHWDGRGTWWR